MTGAQKATRHAEDNDFVQAGDLYRLISPDSKKRLIEAIASTLGRVSREEIIERSIAHFRNADPEYGEQVAKAVEVVRRGITKPAPHPGRRAF